MALRPSGFSLLEVLLVLVIVVVWLGVSFALRPPLAALARDAASTVVSTRARTVMTGASTVVLCDAPAVAANGALVKWPPRGLLFTPDGLPRTCDGGGVGNTTILLEYRGRQAAVIVSSLGRVRWELR